jgi:hypothetical protein
LETRFSRAEPDIHNRVLLTFVVERDGGKFAIGFHDDAVAPFESRPLALAVAERLPLRWTRHDPRCRP